MNTDLRDKYVKALEVCVENTDRNAADGVLYELLSILGYSAVCEAHSLVNKYPRPSTPVEEKPDVAKAIDTVTHNRKSKK